MSAFLAHHSQLCPLHPGILKRVQAVQTIYLGGYLKAQPLAATVLAIVSVLWSPVS